MIGLARPGRARPWQIAAAVTALQRVFQGVDRAEVRCERAGEAHEVKAADQRLGAWSTSRYPFGS